jgi:hypothetical protein
MLDEINCLASQSALTPEEKEATGSICDIIRHVIVTHETIANTLSINLKFLKDLVILVENTSLSPPQHRRVVALLGILLYLPICEICPKGLIKCPAVVNKRMHLPFVVNFHQEKRPGFLYS